MCAGREFPMFIVWSKIGNKFGYKRYMYNVQTLFFTITHIIKSNMTFFWTVKNMFFTIFLQYNNKNCVKIDTVNNTCISKQLEYSTNIRKYI